MGISAGIKRALAALGKHRCEYCHIPESYVTHSFTLDHIIPRSKGGSDKLENLAYSCMGCNAYKHIKTEAWDPVSEKMVNLFNPRVDDWNLHFGWSEDFTQIVGKTGCGMATVNALKFNRRGLVNLRKLLILTREHPISHHAMD